MSHRLQVTLTDEQYAALKAQSAASGASIATLVRRALDPDDAGRSSTTAELLARLRDSAGAWSGRPEGARIESGADYVAAIRRR
ncbi:MAG: hypothetical protein JST73_08480, partial [Actinobacteria bacterium]|nr:hypothetical protein [Actinomycetota bacterium]